MFKQSMIVLVALSALFCLSLANVQEQVEAGVENVAENVGDAADFAQDQAQQLPGASLLNRLQPHVKGLLDLTKDTSMNFYQQAKPLATNIGLDLKQSVDGYIQNNPVVRDNLQKAIPHLSNIHGATMGLVNQGSSLVSRLLNQYGQQGGNMAQQAQTAAGGLGETLNSFAAQAGGTVSSVANNAMETMGNFAGQASGAAGNLVEQARDVANPGAFVEHASNVVNSVASQASGSIGSVMNNFKQ